MNIKRIVLLTFSLLLCLFGYAQQLTNVDAIDALEQKIDRLDNVVKSMQKLKISGFIQTQYQYAEVDADGIGFKMANRANAVDRAKLANFGRFGIRRGRIKLTYESGIGQFVFQPDITEKGIGFKDAYLAIKDPWFGSNLFTAGVFADPFGHEIAYSSVARESPERARIIQSLFPDGRELGFMLTLQPANTSKWKIFKLEAGLFSGNGVRPQINTRMDFVGRLSVGKPIGSNARFGLGVSAYLGGVQQTDAQVYIMKDQWFVMDSNTPDNIGRYAKRQYVGADAQFSITSDIGLTQLRGEYIIGNHPGNSGGAYDFKLTALPNGPVYMRRLSGGYVILSQDLGKMPFTAVVKYDWYDPNTDVSGNAIGAADSHTGAGDIARTTIGLGLLWNINPAFRLTGYYEIISNETTTELKDSKDETGRITAYGYEGQRKENVLTVRLQYKF